MDEKSAFEDFARWDAEAKRLLERIERGEACGSAELTAMAERIVVFQADEAAKIAAMTPEEQSAYITAWAERLAADVAGAND